MCTGIITHVGKITKMSGKRPAYDVSLKLRAVNYAESREAAAREYSADSKMTVQS